MCTINTALLTSYITLNNRVREQETKEADLCEDDENRNYWHSIFSSRTGHKMKPKHSVEVAETCCYINLKSHICR